MRKEMLDTEVDKRAVEIAAEIMQYIGLCRYNSRDECKKENIDCVVCKRCIRNWLRSKARHELRVETEAANGEKDTEDTTK